MPSLVASPPPRTPRYLSLDHWRGIACLLVVVYHSTSVFAFTPRAAAASSVGLEALAAAVLSIGRLGWVGVPIFFVISGYAISAAADRHRRRESGTATYFRRRFRRIYPTYWAWIAIQLAIVFAVDVLLHPRLLTGSVAPIERPWEFAPIQWLGNLTLTESWRAHVVSLGSGTDYLLGQAWTLAYEEQFYLVVGVALLLAPARFFGIAALVTAGTLVVALLVAVTGIGVGGFFFDGMWLIFAAGILVYWQVNYGSSRTQIATWAALLVGVVYALLSASPGLGLDEYLLAGFLFAGLILALHRHDRTIDGAASLRPLRLAGTICFSLYLSHAVIVRSMSAWMYDAGLKTAIATLLIVVPACLAAALAVAWGLHVAVERRFLRSATASAGPEPTAIEGPLPVAVP
jgi:peptidoglycan/LPS O-acetylase OafA/YrhL